MQDDPTGKGKAEEDRTSEEEDPISPFRSLSLEAREQVNEQKRGGNRDWWPMSEELGQLMGGEEEKGALEALRDTVAVLAQSRSRGNWQALGAFLLHTPEAALVAAEEHLGFDRRDETFQRKDKQQVDAFYAAVTQLLEGCGSPGTGAGSDMHDAALMAMKHLSVRGALNSNKARKQMILVFLAGAPSEIRQAFRSTVGWKEEEGAFERPEKLGKLRTWLRTTAGMPSSEDEAETPLQRPGGGKTKCLRTGCGRPAFVSPEGDSLGYCGVVHRDEGRAEGR
jgi:hypothetical protein